VSNRSRAASLFDYLVGAGEHGCRDFEAERLSDLEVDYQPIFGRLFDRQIGTA
jgi:hypothetical protein